MAPFRRIRQYYHEQNEVRENRPKKSPFPIFIFIFGALLPYFLWTFASALFPSSSSSSLLPATLQNSTVYLLTAHPDDEAMFFGPTLHRLKQNNNSIYIICFSTGNNDGIGHIRKYELENSVSYFGTQENHVELLKIVDDPDSFPDSMDIDWNITKVSQTIKQILKETTNGGSFNILTFDPLGVSGHRNHKALFHAAYALSRKHTPKPMFIPENNPEAGLDLEYDLGTKENQKREPSQKKDTENDTEQEFELWILKSVSIFRKYISVLDTFIVWILRKIVAYKPFNSIPTNDSAVIVSSLDEYSKTFYAMTKAHISQMKWFRYGWIIFSRYMIVNDIYHVV